MEEVYNIVSGAGLPRTAFDRKLALDYSVLICCSCVRFQLQPMYNIPTIDYSMKVHSCVTWSEDFDDFNVDLFATDLQYCGTNLDMPGMSDPGRSPV